MLMLEASSAQANASGAGSTLYPSYRLQYHLAGLLNIVAIADADVVFGASLREGSSNEVTARV